jgi:arylsulfatase A
MRRRSFLQTIGTAGLSSHLVGAAKKPNIVYILADDLGWGDLLANNPDSQIDMPNAARLAREGIRFTDMHSPSSVCTPTRYGILTGRYCWRTSLKKGVLNGRSPALIESGRLTVPALLRANGYYTGGVGKWHLGLGEGRETNYYQPLTPGPRDAGFNYYYGIPASLDMEPYLYFENDAPVQQPTERTKGANSPRGYFWREGGMAPGFKMEECLPRLTDRAVKFIRDQKDSRSRPFFLYFPMTGPHTPWAPTAEFKDKSRAGLYGDFAQQVDHSLGQILRALEEIKAEGDTLVIFTSDNGAHWTPDDKNKFSHRANASWKGMKADIWEAGHRVPFLARWPGQIRPGTYSNDLGCLTDLMATVADILGVRLPGDAGEDSVSLLPALRGKKGLRTDVVHHSVEGFFGMRQGEWKLCLGRGSGGFSEPKSITAYGTEPKGELYNLREDPGETKNLYNDNPDQVKKLTDLLNNYQANGRSR